jgi:hypothetical protein
LLSSKVYSFGIVVSVVPVVELGAAGVVVELVVEFCEALGVVPGLVVPGVIVEVAGQGVVEVVPETPVPVVPLAVVVPVVVPEVLTVPPFVLAQSVEPETLELGVVPIDVPPFWLALGVVPAAPGVAPMLPVEVLGLVEGVATPPLGV